ncbi:MAG: GNAT family N-acetyltransferase [Paracoccaceae bacterium]|nr:GNAT family N-acetyltransferase [Paracoccaceae bacterium]MDG1738059.1 GNAT family N-acetyltransferase [Paracoccaceae bacterium]MDG2258944.1 GNAT family N-acetyltransferase [Paracoccaceae bacterium]
MTEFNQNPSLIGENLRLDPIKEADREGLFTQASDPEVWAQHPSNDRYQRGVFDPYFDFLLAAGGTLVAREKVTGGIIGCSRFYDVPEHPGEWGIGFTFLGKPNWGGVWNREMKHLMVQHILASEDRVWFHIGHDNKRSQIATTRLGAQFSYDGTLTVSGRANDMKCYTMTAQDWLAATGLAL